MFLCYLHMQIVPCVCARVYTRENVVSASMSGRRAIESVMYVYVRARACAEGVGRFCVLESVCVILANLYFIPSKIIGARGRCKWKLVLKKLTPHGKQKYRHVYVKVNAESLFEIQTSQNIDICQELEISYFIQKYRYLDLK